MNFFGHAVVASWHDAGGGRALGAMLPDFQTMSGARVAAVDDAEVAAGIDLHHATDAAFHRLPAFVGLTREVEARLRAADVGRGPTRAVAHVGVELLLDGVLLDDVDGCATYLAGLDHPIATITWREPGDDARFAHLHGRLRAYGVPRDLARADAVAHRVLRMIAPRPLLRASAAEAEVIRRELAAMAPRVRVATPTVMAALRAAMTPAPA
ncbi:MAG: hypothetical protein H6709_19675 [Kofleriaceae bacterium]|nr:hypothetical protein [Kofleriaceae bacterium]MCB9574307.1 hypothetical protein [Kofleriaceae bacterium]